MTNWSYLIFESTEIINDALRSNCIDNLPEWYNEALVKNTNITFKENKEVMKKTSL